MCYQEQYKREGKRAMEDLLGELSANTGGIASSYAATAAAQSLDYYNQKIADKIPELYSKAFDKYLEERAEENINEWYTDREIEVELEVNA